MVEVPLSTRHRGFRYKRERYILPILPARIQPPHASLFPLRTKNLYQFLANGYHRAMKSQKIFIFVTFLFVTSLGYSQEISSLIKQFDYDSKAPLDVQEEKVEQSNGILIKEITFASPKGGRVGAYLIVPPGKGPFAGLMFGHWGLGTKMEFIPEALLYAQAGVVSILPDYPWSRAAEWHKNVDDIEHPESDRDTYIQAVIELRRAIDVLQSLGSVDRNRIGYVGHSYGAQWGAILSATDKRLKACVLIGGAGSGEDLWNSNDPDMVAYKKRIPEATLKKYVEINSVLDAVRYIPYASPTALLLQFARYERYFDEASMKKYENAASNPKQVFWYDTGHEVNDFRALVDRSQWLQKYLHFQPILPLLENQLR
jgi:dienelactone hydrolase